MDICMHGRRTHRDVDERVVLARHVGHVGRVRRGDNVLVLLAGEDVNGREVALGVAVLARLGGGHGAHLARVVLDADVAGEKGAGGGVLGKSGIRRVEGREDGSRREWIAAKEMRVDVPSHADLASLHVEDVRSAGIAGREVVVAHLGHLLRSTS